MKSACVCLFPHLPSLQFVLTEMYYDGFHRSFCDDDDDLDIIQESDSIFAFETPETFKLESLRSKRGAFTLDSRVNVMWRRMCEINLINI